VQMYNRLCFSTLLAYAITRYASIRTLVREAAGENSHFFSSH
jgi:hypothetical protein